MYKKFIKNKKWFYLLDHNNKKDSFTLLFQFNNLSTLDWQNLEKQFSKMDPVVCRVVKNKIRPHVEKSTVGGSMFQGPMCTIQTDKVETVFQIFTVLKKMKYNSKLIFIGGVYSNQFYTTLDFEKLNRNPLNQLIGGLETSVSSLCWTFHSSYYQLILSLQALTTKQNTPPLRNAVCRS